MKDLKQMKDAKCIFPDCKKKSVMHVSIPVVKQGEKGIEQVQDLGISIPTCANHFPVLSQFFSAMEQGEGKVALYGNVREVKLMEAVIQGLAMSGDLRKLTLEEQIKGEGKDGKTNT